ncbi:MAG: phosphoribosylformylglycinamidine cyclo-ligase [Gammaproteobacteria bacterium]|nr:phosphoribosylformylglycinamidine cyclo-ligase [Gammaproteobacteria bacterium]
MSQLDYRQAGVDIAAGNEAVARIKEKVQTTFAPAVLTSIGCFGGLFDLSAIVADYQQPVMAQSVDGVGTKTIIARMMNCYDTLGIDLLSATCNDIIVLGAKPLTFLDYIANDKLNPDIIEQLVSGMVTGCRDHNISLVGGETAEMPNVYLSGEHDLVGIITGIVERDKIIDGRTIVPGDKIYAFASNGLHTNGYSLARKALFDKAGFTIDQTLPELGASIGETLLAPHINYTHPVHQLLNQGANIKGMAHITGGGVIENIPRILPENCGVEINTGACPIPTIFNIINEIGELEQQESYRTFNMGIGFILIGDDSIKEKTDQHLYEIGSVINGKHDVILANP